MREQAQFEVFRHLDAARPAAAKRRHRPAARARRPGSRSGRAASGRRDRRANADSASGSRASVQVVGCARIGAERHRARARETASRAPDDGFAARDRRRVPVEREFDLDQHRLDVVDGQHVGLAVDGQARPAARGRADRRAARSPRRSAARSAPSLSATVSSPKSSMQREAVGDVVGDRRAASNSRRARRPSAMARKARMSGESLAISA